MLRDLLGAVRGIALLRHPEIRKLLGEMRLRHIELEGIRASFPRAKLSEGVEIIAFEISRLVLGQEVSVGRGTILAFGDELNGYGQIKIGDNTWIGEYNNLRACGENGDIIIGNNCLISQFCTLVGSNHQSGRERLLCEQGPDLARVGVVMGDDVWMGAGSSVMPGVAIGSGAIIGANSVVTRAVPEYEIWAGCPARKIGERR